MVQKRERSVGGQRRQPERQACELDCHRVQIHAVQASFRNGAPDRHPVAIVHVARMASTLPHQRRLVRVGQIPARGDKKGAASHRGVDDPELEDAIRRKIPDERTERAPHDVVRDWLRRVEGTGRLANAGSTLERDRVGTAVSRFRRAPHGLRLVIEQCLVHGAELLYAEIPVGDPLPSRSVRRRSRRQRKNRTPRRLIVQAAAFGERRPGRREQPSVE